MVQNEEILGGKSVMRWMIWYGIAQYMLLLPP